MSQRGATTKLLVMGALFATALLPRPDASAATPCGKCQEALAQYRENLQVERGRAKPGMAQWKFHHAAVREYERLIRELEPHVSACKAGRSTPACEAEVSSSGTPHGRSSEIGDSKAPKGESEVFSGLEETGKRSSQQAVKDLEDLASESSEGRYQGAGSGRRSAASLDSVDLDDMGPPGRPKVIDCADGRHRGHDCCDYDVDIDRTVSPARITRRYAYEHLPAECCQGETLPEHCVANQWLGLPFDPDAPVDYLLVYADGTVVQTDPDAPIRRNLYPLIEGLRKADELFESAELEPAPPPPDPGESPWDASFLDKARDDASSEGSCKAKCPDKARDDAEQRFRVCERDRRRDPSQPRGFESCGAFAEHCARNNVENCRQDCDHDHLLSTGYYVWSCE